MTFTLTFTHVIEIQFLFDDIPAIAHFNTHYLHIVL